MRTFALSLIGLALGACSSSPRRGPPDEACTFEQHLGMCDLVVVLDPRESEDPFEATSVELRWFWKGSRPNDVEPLIQRWNLQANQAYGLASAYDELDRARCYVAEATAPPTCVGRNRVIKIELPSKAKTGASKAQ